MQSKGNAPSQKQKYWRERLRSLGCAVCSAGYPEIHHVVGATGRHDRVPIGHWFILPLCPGHHRLGPNNVTDYPGRFVRDHGDQVSLLLSMVAAYEWAFDEPAPIPEPALRAIKMTRK